MLAQLSDVTFGYPGTEIFAGVSFQVNPGNRIGLVGPNGAGKSTLLRLLAGRLSPEKGQVARAKGSTLAYLHQSQEFVGAGTLWETLLSPFADLLAMREELAQLERLLEEESQRHQDDAAHAQHLSRYGDLQEIYGRRDGYNLESQARRLAFELGFTDEDMGRRVETLSGGERGRVELAKVLLARPDLLLLDEPTNHLDVEAVEHLESRLSEWEGAFVLVSHDRYFLRATCREIVDVEGTSLVRYPGGWERYVVDREERMERMRAAFDRQQDKIARTEDFIRRNLAGQKTKQAQSRRKMLEKLDRLEQAKDDWADAGNFSLRFSTGDHKGGKEAIRVERLVLGYPEGPPLVNGLDVTIYRGDRVGILGPNGAGKSTLMKALLGRLEPRAGFVHRGHEIRVGYFDQKLGDLDEDRSLIDEIRTIRGDWNEDVARSYLGRFRFSGEEGFRKVKGLSGGERTRLALGKLMLQPRNLLALDEPTNHLDIPAREVLEEALADYDGTLLVVSHDRFFLDRVCNRVIHVESGAVEVHAGNYSDWRERQRATAQPAAPAPAVLTARGGGKTGGGRAAAPSTPAKEPRRGAEAPSSPARAEQAAPTGPAANGDAGDKRERVADREAKKQAERDRQRKQRRFDELEKLVAEAEAALQVVRAELGRDHAGDWQRLHTLAADEQKLAHKVSTLMGEWERLGTELGSPG